MSGQEVIETPEALGKRYWDELSELVEQGEITPSLALRIRAEMFEPAVPGRTPRLRLRFWRSYLKEMRGDFS